jgi:hypothetical protein
MIYYRKTLFGRGPKLTAVQGFFLIFYTTVIKDDLCLVMSKYRQIVNNLSCFTHQP